MGRTSRWGAGVIGEEAFKQEEAIRNDPVQKYGPGILEDGAPKRAKRRPAEMPKQPEGPAPSTNPLAELSSAAADAADQEPADVPDDGQEELPQAPAPADPNSVEGQSIKQVTAAVTANPALVDRYLAAEAKRLPAPRSGVIRALVAAERGGANRSAVLAELEAFLKPAD